MAVQYHSLVADAVTSGPLRSVCRLVAVIQNILIVDIWVNKFRYVWGHMLSKLVESVVRGHYRCCGLENVNFMTVFEPGKAPPSVESYNKRISCRRDTCSKSVKSCQLLHNCTEITFEKVCNMQMTFKVTRGCWKWRYSVGDTSLPPFPRYHFYYVLDFM